MNEEIGNEEYIDSAYVKDREDEAINRGIEYRKYRQYLHLIESDIFNVDEYFDSLKNTYNMEPFEEPKKRYFNRDAGITWWLRIRSLFSDEAKNELAKKQKVANEIFENDRRKAQESYNRRAEKFYQKQKQQNDEIDLRKQIFVDGKGNIGEIENYFKNALASDSFTINYECDYEIKIKDLKYDKKDSTLSFAYKIPTETEMLICNGFYYDSTIDEILPKELAKKESVEVRKDIIRKVLIRALRIVYLSDTYSYIKNVSITGCFEYYDKSYGTSRQKKVIQFNMTREDFEQTDFNKVNINALFDLRLKPKEAKEMYDKNALDVVALK